MPENLVKTPKDEKLWEKAKRLATEEGEEDNYAYIVEVYKRLKREKAAKGLIMVGNTVAAIRKSTDVKYAPGVGGRKYYARVPAPERVRGTHKVRWRYFYSPEAFRRYRERQSGITPGRTKPGAITRRFRVDKDEKISGLKRTFADSPAGKQAALEKVSAEKWEKHLKQIASAGDRELWCFQVGNVVSFSILSPKGMAYWDTQTGKDAAEVERKIREAKDEFMTLMGALDRRKGKSEGKNSEEEDR